MVDDFIEFIRGAELVIHNAPFDVGFIDNELGLLKADRPHIKDICGVLDTLKMARDMHPGQRNNLDALCKRYEIDNSSRDKHGALLDAEILADVYLAMTGGQVAPTLSASDETGGQREAGSGIRRLPTDRPRLQVIRATADELVEHQQYLEKLDQSSGADCVWRSVE